MGVCACVCVSVSLFHMHSYSFERIWKNLARGFLVAWWRSDRALDLQLTGRGFKSQPVRYHVTQVNSALHPSRGR